MKKPSVSDGKLVVKELREIINDTEMPIYQDFLMSLLTYIEYLEANQK